MKGEEVTRVLVVDDNGVNRLVLQNQLSRSGYEVEEAPGGKEAISFLGLDEECEGAKGTAPVDAVILDVMMPEIDGLEVLRQVRERWSASDLPVIMATAKDESEDITAALELGANDYVVKPIDMPVLLARLKTQVSLKQTHLALKEAQHSLIDAAKMESVGYLAAGVAHEVRNPLAQIQMGVDAIGGTEAARKDPSIPALIELVTQGVEKADAIVRELMKVSMSGQLDLVPGSINESLREALDSLEGTLAGSSVTVKCDLAENLPEVPMAEIELRQVFVNVLKNAIEAMPGGGNLVVRSSRIVVGDSAQRGQSRSGVRLRKGDEAVLVEIEDSGPGIPERSRQQVFDPFFTTKATGKGTGLGLSVARKITSLHRGSISVESGGEGTGARVEIQLPTTGSMHPII